MKASDFETAKGLLDERGDLCDLLASLGEGCELQVMTTSCHAPSIDVPAAAPLVAQVKAWAGGRIAAIDAELTPDYTRAYQRVCCHYLRHGCFIDPASLLSGVARIRHLLCHIVNGRFDAVCPPTAAWRLKQAWPEAELQIVPMAGHTTTEPAMAEALRAVMQGLAGRLAAAPGAEA